MISIAAKNDAMVPTGLYMNSLNEMIDDQERRLTAIRSQVPMIVIYGLYGIAIIAVTFTGYAAGLEKQSSRLPSCVLSMVIALVLLLIQDVNRPSVGFMQVSQQPFLDTAASLGGYTGTNSLNTVEGTGITKSGLDRFRLTATVRTGTILLVGQPKWSRDLPAVPRCNTSRTSLSSAVCRS
jgi:hypothetical protein